MARRPGTLNHTTALAALAAEAVAKSLLEEADVANAKRAEWLAILAAEPGSTSGLAMTNYYEGLANGLAAARLAIKGPLGMNAIVDAIAAALEGAARE